MRSGTHSRNQWVVSGGMQDCMRLGRIEKSCEESYRLRLRSSTNTVTMSIYRRYREYPSEDSGITMKKATCKLVAYLRVSTKGQGVSGLGLEGQEIAIKRYAEQCGCTVSATYTEVESGKRHDNRPELARAMAHARRSGNARDCPS